MKNILNDRLRWLLVFVMLLTGSTFADSSKTLHPGWGTTLNGKPVYFSVRIAPGDQIKTANESSMITFGGAELEVSPNSTLVIGDSFVLGSGTIVSRFGKAEISNDQSSIALASGEAMHSASSGCNTLPDAPSAVRDSRELQASRKARKRHTTAPAAAIGGLYGDLKIANWPFWTVNGAMWGSSLAAAEFTHTCLQAGACSSVPDTLHSRKVMLATGVPALLGVSYLDYYLKKKGTRWWFVPPALVTVGNIVVATHGARYSH
jgi:hypothetical protein